MVSTRMLIAPQEFKGTLTAVEAANSIAARLGARFPSWDTDLLPMADGGPGTTDALLAALGGTRRITPACDPLMRPIEAGWGLLPGDRAVIECAAASGLLRLRSDELDPHRATSYGTGQLIAAALDDGIEEMIVGLGGSATNDGGGGMAKALGYDLLDRDGQPLPPGGAELGRLHHIETATAHPGLARLRCLGATDVTNPLCGPSGASAVYGPQKGADAAAVAELDSALEHFAAVVKRDLGVDVTDIPGAGAAGGLGAGLIAFLRADLRSGAAVVGEAANIEARIAAADVVITGEGRLDAQTAYGKSTAYVAGLARSAGKPVVCLAGSLGDGNEAARDLFATIETLGEVSERLPEREEASRRLAAASERAVQTLIDRGLLLLRNV